MSSIVASPLSLFPAEILLHILEEAAATSRDTCIALCLVASWARQLALPYLLSTVVLKLYTPRPQVSALKEFVSMENTTIRASHPGAFVRSLWLSWDHAPLLPDLLASCTNLQYLAAPERLISDVVLEAETQANHGDVIPSNCIGDLRLTVFSTTPDAQMSAAWKTLSPLFARVTHLHIQATRGAETQFDLRAFPRLTHLALPRPDELSVLPFYNALLESEAPRLQTLVLNPPRCGWARPEGRGVDTWLRLLRGIDKRVIVGDSGLSTLYHRWMDEVDGEESMWERAERVTARWEKLNM